MRRTRSRIPRFSPAAGLLVALVAAGARAGSAGDAVRTVSGSSGGDELGASMAAVGDVDGDKVPDFAVGSEQGGYVLVCSGKDGSTILTLKGSSSEAFGRSVAGAGDTDGDGVPDILVGAPYASSGKQQEGAAYLFSGKDGSSLQTFWGDYGGDGFGWSVAGVGDLDGDGYDDVVIGAPWAYDPYYTGGNTGMVKVYLGGSWSQAAALYGDYYYDEFGISVCALGGDGDGDGAPDFAVGADYGVDPNWNTTGYVRVFSGSYGNWVTTIYGSGYSDGFGVSVAGAGDVDGDGGLDLLVGTEYGTNKSGAYSGTVTVLAGGSWKAIRTLHGVSDYEMFGHSVAGGLDLDEDDVPDIVVGAPYMTDEYGSTTGGARLYSGADGVLIGTLPGASYGDRCGTSVAMLPDLTGDGLAEWAAGSPGDDSADKDAGAAYVLAGPGTRFPRGTIVVNGDAAATSSTDVSLSFTWQDGASAVADMRVRDEDGDWTDWLELTDALSWTLPDGDGKKVVEVQFRGQDGTESKQITDSIVLDTAAPSGSVAISAGATWACTLDVTLSLTWSDSGSGVAEVRARNEGGQFGAWTPIGATIPWTMKYGGPYTVEVQFRDVAGNVSATASDAIQVDLEPPTGSMAIEGGVPVIRTPNVMLSLAATDTGGSGISKMRFRRTGAPVWSNWFAFAPNIGWSLPDGDGEKSVDAQFCDLAGNLSQVYVDTVLLDEDLPTVVSFRLHEPRAFYLPQEQVGFDLVASDAAGGSGVESARTSWDGGATWTAWTNVSSGEVYFPARPSRKGPCSVCVVVRDRAGNASHASAPLSVFLTDGDLPEMGSGGRSAGTMDALDDVDVVAVDLVKGDVLNVTLRGRSGVRKQSFALAVDLSRPDGGQLVAGRWPESLRAAGIKGFTVPETGKYLLIVRHADAEGSETGSYTMKVSVRHSRSNAVGTGTSETGQFTVEAAHGSRFGATLKGEGIDPASVTVEGPDGAVVVTATLRRGKVVVSPVALSAGTGVYRVKFTATGPVSFRWTAALPRGNARLTE